jgi:heme peroxidase
MPRTHAVERGLEQFPDSRPPSGKFGRMFGSLPAADFKGTLNGKENQPDEKILKALADEMIEAVPVEGLIPAGYTYLGQFISHDLTFDPVTSLQKDRDPAAMVDFRTPRFDLDSVYGRGPSDDPYLYWKDGVRMRLGKRLTDGNQLVGYDVPRSELIPSGGDSSDHALIGDPRNDENVIIAQLHALFLRFHNRMADILEADPENSGKQLTFEEVQKEVRWHYQWVILYDFLPRLIHPRIYNQILPHVNGKKADYDRLPLHPNSKVRDNPPSLTFYRLDKEPYMPVEFSAAAYRFGHSMVRDEYRLNKNPQPVTGGPFKILSNHPPLDLQGFRRFRDDWAIDWELFFDEQQAQRAFQIDTSLAEPLKMLPFPFAEGLPNLAERNLVRGRLLGLPSGQSVARMFDETPLLENELTVAGKNIADISPAFHNNAPLWFYILAEAQNWMTEAKQAVPARRQSALERGVGLSIERMGKLRWAAQSHEKELREVLKARDRMQNEFRDQAKKRLEDPQRTTDRAQTKLAEMQTKLRGAKTEDAKRQAKQDVDNAQAEFDKAQIALAEAQSKLSQEQNKLFKPVRDRLNNAVKEAADAKKQLVKQGKDLVEAQKPLAKYATLGAVGSRIVMETFVGLLWGDEYSFLRQEPGWKPWPVRQGQDRFGMMEFARFAASGR